MYVSLQLSSCAVFVSLRSFLLRLPKLLFSSQTEGGAALPKEAQPSKSKADRRVAAKRRGWKIRELN